MTWQMDLGEFRSSKSEGFSCSHRLFAPAPTTFRRATSTYEKRSLHQGAFTYIPPRHKHTNGP